MRARLDECMTPRHSLAFQEFRRLHMEAPSTSGELLRSGWASQLKAGKLCCENIFVRVSIVFLCFPACLFLVYC